MHLTLAFEQGFRLDAKPVTADIVEQVLSRAIDDLEPTLTRNGYDATAIAQQFNAKPSEVRAFLAGSLDPDRGRELTEQLRQAGGKRPVTSVGRGSSRPAVCLITAAGKGATISTRGAASGRSGDCAAHVQS